METKDNLIQTMSEKQNEVITEMFIADFALIDASMVRTKSIGDIANETVSSSYTAFY